MELNITEEVMMSNPRILQATVEDIVADTLKHAPARCKNVSSFGAVFCKTVIIIIF